MLLHWCTLEPTGSSHLAAIRFSNPVRVQSIRIFPTDTQPFAQNPEIRSRTEPQSFFLDIYFNAYILDKDKPKATNVLVPTTIAYTGGQMDFSVAMGTEYTTRLMVVKGSFQCVSMAIYGDMSSEPPSPPQLYNPRPLSTIEPHPLSSVMDPCNSLDPTYLARQLLSLIPDAPPLSLIIRLMFCLKPSNEDWDLPEFPYLHPALDEDMSDLDLRTAFQLTTRPVADDISKESLTRFVHSIADSLGPKDRDQAYFTAGILYHTASQHQDMGKLLLQRLDFTKIFEAPDLDESTIDRLVHAATNADIARHLNVDWFLELIDAVVKDSQDNETRLVASKLITRIRGWETLEDAFLNSQGDFSGAASMIAEVGQDERDLGIWLESMVTHQDITATLSENPVFPMPLTHPPLLLQSVKSSISHDEFIAFLRAFIGVSCVLAVYAWADSLPHERCRERALAMLRLWQSVDGYREIVEHLLLLRQMTFRLECMTDNDPPTRAGDDAERILVNLCKNPFALLSPDLNKCIQSLEPPHSFITEEERLSMQQAAQVARDGLPCAVDELKHPIQLPLTFTTLRTLRVALAIVERELQMEGEWNVLEEFWQEGSCSMVIRLVEVFLPVTEEIKLHFSLRPPSAKPQILMSHLFRLSDELVRLLLRLIPAYTLPSRVIRLLTTKVADLFTCTDAADMLYLQSSSTCVAAQETRQSCIDLIRVLADAHLESNKLGLEVVLRTLLQHGLHSEDRDPAHHLLQIFCLIDFLLPMPDSEDGPASWMQRVMPNLLHDIWAFCRVLDTENKVHFVRRLVDLDRGLIGIGEWLLLEELKDVLDAAHSLEDPSLLAHQRLMKQYQISLSLRFLLDLIRTSLGASRWCIDCLATEDEAVHLFSVLLTFLLEQRLVSPHLTELIEIMASESFPPDHGWRNLAASVLLRSTQATGLPTATLNRLLHSSCIMLSSSEHATADADLLRLEIGTLFATFTQPSTPMETSTAEVLLSLLEWLTAAAAEGLPDLYNLRGISSATYSTFCERVREVLPSDLQDPFALVKDKISITEDTSPTVPSIPLPESVQLSMHDVEDLLRSEIPVPSTPPRNALNQDVLGLVTFSPVALIRSPTAATTGLTKTYVANDFRQLRQAPSARQNTSRLPSMHVDEFESASSPTLVTVPMPPAVPVTVPFATAEGFQPLAPPFAPL